MRRDLNVERTGMEKCNDIDQTSRPLSCNPDDWVTCCRDDEYPLQVTSNWSSLRLPLLALGPVHEQKHRLQSVEVVAEDFVAVFLPLCSSSRRRQCRQPMSHT